MTIPASPSSSRQQYLLGMLIAITGAVLFSAKAIVAKLMYRYNVDAEMVLGLRMLFSLPFFILTAIWQGRQKPRLPWSDLLRIMLMGFVGYYLSSYLDFLGLEYITAGLERLLLFLTPTFVLFLSIIFLKRKVSALEWVSLGIAYLGTVFVFIHDARHGGTNVVRGSLLVLTGAFTYAIYLMQSGLLVKRIGPLRLVAYAMIAASAACIVQLFALKPVSVLVSLPAGVYWLSLANAIFCTVAPVYMTMIAISRIGAAATAQSGMVGPVSTLFLGAAVLGEPITGIQLFGTALVMTGIYLLSRKKV